MGTPRPVSGLTALIPPAFPGNNPVALWTNLTDHRDGFAPESHRLPVLRRTPCANLNVYFGIENKRGDVKAC